MYSKERATNYYYFRQKLKRFISIQTVASTIQQFLVVYCHYVRVYCISNLHVRKSCQVPETVICRQLHVLIILQCYFSLKKMSANFPRIAVSRMVVLDYEITEHICINKCIVVLQLLFVIFIYYDNRINLTQPIKIMNRSFSFSPCTPLGSSHAHCPKNNLNLRL